MIHPRKMEWWKGACKHMQNKLVLCLFPQDYHISFGKRLCDIWLGYKTACLKRKNPLWNEVKKETKPSKYPWIWISSIHQRFETGKLDSHTLSGHFVGYDIKSKGYRIYWPTKRTISVERNVVINDNDITSMDNITFDSGDCQGTSLAVCTPLYTLLIIHIPPSFYFAYNHLLLFGYDLNLSCSQ